MNHHEKLISTARFAKMCGVSKQTIIYYDNIGLFHPHYIDEKGYRYYTLYQLELFQVLKVLKTIGTPLGEMKTYIENRNPDSYLQLLNKHKKEIEKQIEELKITCSSINGEIEKVKEGKSILDDTAAPYIEIQRGKQIIVSGKIDSERELLDITREIGDLEETIEEQKIRIYSINGMIEKESLICGKKDFNITNIYIEAPNEAAGSIVKPRGRYVSIYHKGTFEETHKSYAKLMKFIEENRLTIKGNAYEEVLLGLSSQKENEYVLKISILI